ncbi:hypothetical protein GX411_03135 [Candidatus Fermentibacteria bacterium]|nr:hypothetical protein [Candidatus Fermentibacteria bacterium]
MDFGRRLTLAVLAAASLARLAVFAYAARGGILVGEGRVTADIAVNLLEGRGLTLSESMLTPRDAGQGGGGLNDLTFEFYRRLDGFYGVLRPGRPTGFFVPGYILFEAAIFAVAGHGNLLAVRGVQLLMGLVSVWAGLSIARRFLSGRWLALAGIALALNPFELYYEAIPSTQGLFSPLFLVSVLLSLEVLERGGLPTAAAAALSWAAGYLVRPAALPVSAWLAVCMILQSAGRRAAPPRQAWATLLFVAVFMLSLVPWGMRQQRVTGEFRITPTQGGVNLWEYNGRIFSDRFEHEQQGALTLYGPLRESLLGRLRRPELAEFPEFRDEPEWYRDSVLTARTIEFLKANPVLLARLPLLRFVEFFKPFPLNRFPVAYILAGLASFGLVLVFAGAGAVSMARRRTAGAIFLVGGAAVYSLLHLATAAGTPHRVAIDSILIVLACEGLRIAWSRRTAR